VIAYEILYGKFPFFLYNEKTHSEIYKYKEYTNHWFYTPEELKNYGDSSVFPLLQLIFGRCLDPDPGRRPQLDWLCLMLRECIDFYL
jgi:serine/threonine protein kinase